MEHRLSGLSLMKGWLSCWKAVVSGKGPEFKVYVDKLSKIGINLSIRSAVF
jgi:hypothetical protein